MTDDNEPPSISCPPSQTFTVSCGLTSALVGFPTATASDNCGTAVVRYSSSNVTFIAFENRTVSMIQAEFPVSTTKVTAVATDDGGRNATCQFNVTFVEGTSQIASLTFVLASWCITLLLSYLQMSVRLTLQKHWKVTTRVL